MSICAAIPHPVIPLKIRMQLLILALLFVLQCIIATRSHAAQPANDWQSEWDLSVQILDTGGWKEGVGLDAIGGAYALMDKAAHPNAAKILINWLLSRDGQIALQRDRESAGRTDSLRIDIPKTDVLPLMRRRDGVKYLLMWNPEWMEMKPVQELINQVLDENKKN